MASRILRLQRKIQRLRDRQEAHHVPSSSPGNPYWQCSECGVHDPELSIRQGRHFGRCSIQGLEKEIDFYTQQLHEAEYVAEKESK